jgi:excisionase family DNA binding protein
MKRAQRVDLVTVPEAQRRTGLGRRQFRRAIESGELPVYDVGGWRRVRWSDVLAWIESTRRARTDHPAEAHHARKRG